MSNLAKFEKFKDQVGRRLKQLKAEKQTVRFWWRDDDATHWTPQLEQLVTLSSKHQTPLFLAVIPNNVVASLAEELKDKPLVSVIQHGYSHISRALEGEKKSEFPRHIALSKVEGEVANGMEKLKDLFGPQFQPGFVPPWNRFAQEHLPTLKKLNHRWISTYGQSSDPFYVNTHFDIINWRGDRSFIGEDAAIDLALKLLNNPPQEPIGILTHHLDHDQSLWDFLEFFISFLSDHENVIWTKNLDLFAKGVREPIG